MQLLQYKIQYGSAELWKTIYPKNITLTAPNTTYQNYFRNFIRYIDHKDLKNIHNLWMVIGATNTNLDLSRFGRQYDISITGDEINLLEPELLTLYANNELIIRNHPEENAIYDKNIYHILKELLPEKFSKIIYDWSVTKFIPNILNDLIHIKDLLTIHGELYIDTVRPGSFFVLQLFPLNDNFIIKFNGTPPSIDRVVAPTLVDGTVITPQSPYFENFYNYNNDYVLYNANMTEKIYHHKKLFEKMNQDGIISRSDVDSHLVTYNKQTEDDEHQIETIRQLIEIFNTDNFLVEYINDNYEPTEDIYKLSNYPIPITYEIYRNYFTKKSSYYIIKNYYRIYRFS